MPGEMNTSIVEAALLRLGNELGDQQDIEILLVGGAAAMITGLLPPSRTTIDCDVMVYLPSDMMARVERVAEKIAGDLDLAPNWLNSDVQIRLDALPEGWNQRKILVGIYTRLRVSAASRPDLIAMKVLAGRDQDIEDLQAMRVRRDDVDFVNTYLDKLAEKGTSLEQIKQARELLSALEIHDHE